MGRRTEIDRDLCTSAELRAMAHGKLPALTIKRMLAIANALDGMSYTEAARAAGMERQALGDAIKRYNADGIDGLIDPPRGGRPRLLTSEQEAELSRLITEGPDPEVDGLCAYTLDDLCDIVKDRFGVSYTDRGMSYVVKRLGFSRQ